MGRTYREFLNEKLKNPEFKKEWDELEPEYQLIKAMLRARDEQKISQRQLSDMTGITQADISKMKPDSSDNKENSSGSGHEAGTCIYSLDRDEESIAQAF